MKNARHEEILELIRVYDIETQEELADRLRAAGFNVTQATVSRDIRQLALRKISSGGGRQKYSALPGSTGSLSERYQRVLRDAFVSLDISLNIGVIKTVSGMAMAAAAALDSLDWSEVLGCTAGDDTILVVLRAPEDADSLRKKIENIVKES